MRAWRPIGWAKKNSADTGLSVRIGHTYYFIKRDDIVAVMEGLSQGCSIYKAPGQGE